jgi:hypothetical protein
MLLHLQSDVTAPPVQAEKIAGFAWSSENEGALRSSLRRELAAQARCGTPISYKRLAGVLPAAVVETTSALRHALEQLMEEGDDAGRPFVAALAVSALASGLPEPWFFDKAASLGKLGDQPEALEAFAFHAIEFHRSVSHYSRRGGE